MVIKQQTQGARGKAHEIKNKPKSKYKQENKDFLCQVQISHFHTGLSRYLQNSLSPPTTLLFWTVHQVGITTMAFRKEKAPHQH